MNSRSSHLWIVAGEMSGDDGLIVENCFVKCSASESVFGQSQSLPVQEGLEVSEVPRSSSSVDR